jgi:anti-anti-sigma factor
VTISEPLNLSGMEVMLDRRAEWKQIYNECWRQMRDFFYAENMHGVNWPAMRKKYEPLVAHVNHRADLTYIIGEMIGELNCGHSYVGGGELPPVTKTPMGLLGAQFERDPATGFFKITKILDEQAIQSIGDQLFALVEAQGKKKLVVNFSKVEYLSSAAIGKLVALKRKIDAAQGKLALCCIAPAPGIGEIFDIMGLRKVFKIFPDEQEALQAF